MNTRALLLGGASAIALGAAALMAAEPVYAQSALGTVTTQSGQKADAATFFAQSAGGRTTCSTTQDTVVNETITITPPAGNFVYLTGLYLEGAANATGASSAVVWTSTNLTGSPAWLMSFTATAAANPSAQVLVNEQYPTALKSTVAGTAVTILPQTTAASAFQCAHAIGYFNPS